MKKIFTVLLSLIFVCVVSLPVMAKNNRGNNHRGQSNYKHHKGNKYQKHNKRYNHHSQRYNHREFNGKRHSYKGHYGSWNSWERYKRQHPNIERRGRYYRQDGHLMFGFNDGSGSFFFSIGR